MSLLGFVWFLHLLAALLCRGDCGVTSTFNPPNGSIIVREVGHPNTTFFCKLVVEGSQSTTQWNILNFRGVKGSQSILTVLPSTILSGTSSGGAGFSPTFRDMLTFPEYIQDLHGTTLTCGTPTLGLAYVMYFLYIYRQPSLQVVTNPLRYLEGGPGTLSPEVGITAFPFPSMFEWTGSEGITVQNDSRRMFGYPALIINNIQRSDSGTYTLAATNSYLNENSMEVMRSGTGSFTVDVLYGPDIVQGPAEHAVRLGDPVMLLCGTGLDSNPQATVRWTSPAGQSITDNDRYDLTQNNAGTVRLDFTNATIGDRGIWVCNITVSAMQVSQPNSDMLLSETTVGTFVSEITLHLVVAPGRPSNLSADFIGSTWASLSWTHPLQTGEPGIAFYTVIATDMSDGSMVTASTLSNSPARLNITDLQPNVAYSFRVQAVAMALDVSAGSELSNPITGMTTTSAPILLCNAATPGRNVISVAWSLNTGGLSTSLSITYIILRDNMPNVTRDGPVVTSDSTSAAIMSLVAGYTYLVALAATNAAGSDSTACPQVELSIGIPQKPEAPTVTNIGGGQVTVLAHTLISGLPPKGGSFSFMLTVTETPGGDPADYDINIANYSSGDFVTFTLDQIMPGNYVFEVCASNEFGMSDITSITRSISREQGPTDRNAGNFSSNVVPASILIQVILTITIILFIFKI